MNNPLRDRLVSITLEWEEQYGVAPRTTSAISEYDAAMLVGFPEREYSRFSENQRLSPEHYRKGVRLI